MITEWVSERCYWLKKQESLRVYYYSPVKNTFLENTNIFMNLDKEFKPQENKNHQIWKHMAFTGKQSYAFLEEKWHVYRKPSLAVRRLIKQEIVGLNTLQCPLPTDHTLLDDTQ